MIGSLRGAGRRLARPFVRRCGLLLGHAEGDRGVIAVLAAFLLTVTVTSAALSLDIAGRVAEVRRDQATADLAALDAARNLVLAQTLAATSARRNGVDNTKSGNTVTAVLGQLSVVNGKNVFSVDDLKNVLAPLKHGDAVALLVERAQQWSYVAFNLP